MIVSHVLLCRNVYRRQRLLILTKNRSVVINWTSSVTFLQTLVRSSTLHIHLRSILQRSQRNSCNTVDVSGWDNSQTLQTVTQNSGNLSSSLVNLSLQLGNVLIRQALRKSINLLCQSLNLSLCSSNSLSLSVSSSSISSSLSNSSISSSSSGSITSSLSISSSLRGSLQCRSCRALSGRSFRSSGAQL